MSDQAPEGGDARGERVIMQRDGELARIAVPGWLIDRSGRCTVLAIQERTGDWLIYPHGAAKLGIRLTDEQARQVAQTILDGTR